MAIQRIQVRRDTQANWDSTNPVLAAGEPAFAVDSGTLKVGDGTRTWTALPTRGRSFLDVRDYGAKGDGTTDDTATIQAALDAAAAAASPTRTVIVPAGTYVVTQVQLPAGVTLRGAGGIIKSKAAATVEPIRIPATSAGATVEFLEVDGNDANQTTNIVGIRCDAPRSTIRGCYVHNVKLDGIVVAHGDAVWVTVEGNRVNITGRYGITLSADVATACPQHVVVHGNHVEASNDGALGIVGIAKFVTFSSNTTRNHGGDGIAAYNAENRDITCVGNTFENPGNHAMHLGGERLVIQGNTAVNVGTGHAWFVKNHDASLAVNATVTGNVVKTTTAGEGVRCENVTALTVVGNVCESIYRDGIYLADCADVAVQGNTIRSTTTGRGIHLLRTQRGTIGGNAIRSTALEGIYGRDAAGATICQMLTVVGNTIHTTGGRGIYSIEASNRWLVDSNVIFAFTTAAVTLAGANNVLGTNLTT